MQPANASLLGKTVRRAGQAMITLVLVLMVVFLLVLLKPTVLLGSVYLSGVVLVAMLLIYEHSLVKKDDLSKVNMAFFNVNGIISIGLMVFVIVDCVWV